MQGNHVRVTAAALTALVVCAVTYGAPSSVRADVVFVEPHTAGERTGFEAGRCDALATIEVDVPPDALRVEPFTLPRGTTVVAFSEIDAGVLTRSTATITSRSVERRRGGPVAVWSAAPSSELCAAIPPGGADPGWFGGWDAYRIGYYLRRRVRITRSDFRGLTRVALLRRYRFYENSQGTTIRCGKPHRNTALCVVFFFAGDTVFRGRVVSRLVRTVDRQGLLWSYRLRVVQTSEYCQFVTMNYPCSEVHRVEKSGLGTPGFVTRR